MNNQIHIEITTDPTADETAAAIAAILSLMTVEEVADSANPTGRWRDATKLVAQGMISTRTPTRPQWGTIERLHRAGKGGSGVTGM